MGSQTKSLFSYELQTMFHFTHAALNRRHVSLIRNTCFIYAGGGVCRACRSHDVTRCVDVNLWWILWKEDMDIMQMEWSLYNVWTNNFEHLCPLLNVYISSCLIEITKNDEQNRLYIIKQSAKLLTLRFFATLLYSHITLTHFMIALFLYLICNAASVNAEVLGWINGRQSHETIQRQCAIIAGQSGNVKCVLEDERTVFGRQKGI